MTFYKYCLKSKQLKKNIFFQEVLFILWFQCFLQIGKDQKKLLEFEKSAFKYLNNFYNLEF